MTEMSVLIFLTFTLRPATDSPVYIHNRDQWDLVDQPDLLGKLEVM